MKELSEVIGRILACLAARRETTGLGGPDLTITELPVLADGQFSDDQKSGPDAGECAGTELARPDEDVHGEETGIPPDWIPARACQAELNRQDNGRPERLHARPDAPGGDEYRSRSCLTEFMSTDAPARRRQKPISPHREDRRADCPDAPADRTGDLDQRALVLSHKEDRGAVMIRQRAVQRREYIGIIHGKTPSIAPANVAIATSQRNETPCAG